MVLMRTDPFRELDRLSQQLLGTSARPTLMPMDAWRESDSFVVELDLPGVDADSIDLDVERNVLTIHAERPDRQGGGEILAAERPRGSSPASWSSATTSTSSGSARATATASCG